MAGHGKERQGRARKGNADRRVADRAGEARQGRARLAVQEGRACMQVRARPEGKADRARWVRTRQAGHDRAGQGRQGS